jgi:hypothetical protein
VGGLSAAFGFNWILHLMARREERRGAFGAATQVLAMQFNDFHIFSLAMAALQEQRVALPVEAPRWLFTQSISVTFNETLHQRWKALCFVFSSQSGADVVNQFTLCEMLHFDLARLLEKHRTLALEIQAVLRRSIPNLNGSSALTR